MGLRETLDVQGVESPSESTLGDVPRDDGRTRGRPLVAAVRHARVRADVLVDALTVCRCRMAAVLRDTACCSGPCRPRQVPGA